MRNFRTVGFTSRRSVIAIGRSTIGSRRDPEGTDAVLQRFPGVVAGR